MRIESALTTSKEGINVHSTAISAIGDNIANINTTGFKGQRTEFSNLVADGLAGGSSSTEDSGGNGVKVSQVRSLHTEGAVEPTNRPLDVSIDGEGFFTVGDPTNPLFTRAGNFAIDADGNLVTGTGQDVLGFAVTNGVPATTMSTINLLNFNANAVPTSLISMIGNVNSGAAITTVPASPQTFKELNASASYLASTDAIDSLGESHSITFGFFKTANNTYTVQAYVDGADVGGTAGVPSAIGSGTLTFNSAGSIDEANAAAAKLTLTPAYSNGATAGNFVADLSSFTQFSSQSTLGSITNDGFQSGSLTGYEFLEDGSIVATLNNGNQAVIASLALSTFNNVDGLQRAGDNLFRATSESGAAITGTAGTGPRGDLVGGTLERSNVEFGNEFTNLIIYQRGFQANSKMLTNVRQAIDQAIGMLR